MGISLAKLGVTKDRKAAVMFDGGAVVNVSYDATKLSAAAINKITSAIDDDDHEGAAKLFVSIITAWDLEGPIGEGEHEIDEGDIIPLTPEVVAYVPGPVLNAILESVMESANPKSKKK